MKALIYVRVSDDRQADNTSLDSQEAVCRDWCTQRSIEVDRVFRDAGESAKTADRPQFQAMLRYTQSHQRGSINYLLVYKFNRFARTQHDHVVYGSLLRSRHIEVRSATEHTDDSNFGRAMEGFISVFNQLDNDIRAENTMRGMKSRLESGRWQWRAPLGYRNGDRTGPSLVIDATPAPLVRLIFERLASGRRKSEALAEAHRRGLRSKNGNQLTPSTLDKLVREPHLLRAESSYRRGARRREATSNLW